MVYKNYFAEYSVLIFQMFKTYSDVSANACSEKIMRLLAQVVVDVSSTDWSVLNQNIQSSYIKRVVQGHIYPF